MFSGVIERDEMKSVYKVITKLDTRTRFQCKNYENSKDGKSDSIDDKKYLNLSGQYK